MDNFEKDLKELLLQYAREKVKADDIKDETDLIRDLGYDSISIIRLITDIELKFDFEFDDEYLSIELIGIYKDLRDYVAKKITKSDANK